MRLPFLLLAIALPNLSDLFLCSSIVMAGTSHMTEERVHLGDVDGSTHGTPGSCRKAWPIMTNVLMNRTRSRIIRCLVQHGPADSEQIRLRTGLSISTVRYNIRLLLENALVHVSIPHTILNPGPRKFVVDQTAVRRCLSQPTDLDSGEEPRGP